MGNRRMEWVIVRGDRDGYDGDNMKHGCHGGERNLRGDRDTEPDRSTAFRVGKAVTKLAEVAPFPMPAQITRPQPQPR